MFGLCIHVYLITYVYTYIHPYVGDPVKLKIFVRCRFQGSCYCSKLNFCMCMYIYEYNRNIQELENDDAYIMVH